MTGVRRVAMWAGAVLCAAAGVGLVVIAAVVDLDTADRAASVVGGVVALGGTVGMLYQILAGGGAAGVRAQGNHAIAAGGSITGNAIGRRSRVAGAGAGPANGPAPAAGGVEAVGDGSLAAGGNVSGNAVGDDSGTS